MKLVIDIPESIYETIKEEEIGNVVYKAIKNGTQLQEERWIPVSDRLPEENKTVIASTEYGVYPETKYTKEYGWEWAYEAGADYWKELEDVTAWMPLPTKYEPYPVIYNNLTHKPCEDAISRQAVHEAIEKWAESMAVLVALPTREVRPLLESIHKLPPVNPQPKWIPVSERLPEKDMACLVAVGKFNLTQMAMYSDLMGIINHRIFYQGDYGNDNFENITQYVKAWMPLPKPYEPQERNDKECI